MSIMMVPGSGGKEFLVCGKATADDIDGLFVEKDNKWVRSMKTVNVVAAIICDDYNKKTKIFATQRG